MCHVAIIVVSVLIILMYVVDKVITTIIRIVQRIFYVIDARGAIAAIDYRKCPSCDC